jgi:4-diphosphocytidyl-2C-methyl-D-erythritol kinase
VVSEVPWSSLRNDLEAVVTAAWPPVAAALAAARTLGGRRVAVTGSGAAVYAVLEEWADAEGAAARLAERGWRLETTSTLTREAAALTLDVVSLEESQ